MRVKLATGHSDVFIFQNTHDLDKNSPLLTL